MERCIPSFTDLEKAYDTLDRHGMWQMLRVYGVGGKLLKVVQSSANGGRFEINQLLFEDDTALVTDSEDKLCRLVEYATEES